MTTDSDIADLVESTNALTSVAEALMDEAGESISNFTTFMNTAAEKLAEVTLAIVNFEKSIVNTAAFKNIDETVGTQCELKVNVNGVVYLYLENTAVQLPTLVSGTDYAIYATADGLIASANFTMPESYTELTSRRIAGFHYGDEKIYPHSFWDLKFKPVCDDPRGMVKTLAGFWADIYLLNTSPDLLGTSAYNVQIADGSSAPKIPAAWGGDGATQYTSFTQYIAAEVLAAYGKRLPSSQEFETLARGSLTGHTNITDPVTTAFDEDARSLIGCEQVTGHMWQWGAEKWDRGNGSSGYAFYAADTNEEGSVYSAGSAGVGASLFGGGWVDAGSAGSRASHWYNEPWYSSGSIGARGVCDHLQLL